MDNNAYPKPNVSVFAEIYRYGTQLLSLASCCYPCCCRPSFVKASGGDLGQINIDEQLWNQKNRIAACNANHDLWFRLRYFFNLFLSVLPFLCFLLDGAVVYVLTQLNDSYTLAAFYGAFTIIGLLIGSFHARFTAAAIESKNVIDIALLPRATAYYLIRDGLTAFSFFEAITAVDRFKHRVTLFVYYTLLDWQSCLFSDFPRMLMALLALLSFALKENHEKYNYQVAILAAASIFFLIRFFTCFFAIVALPFLRCWVFKQSIGNYMRNILCKNLERINGSPVAVDNIVSHIDVSSPPQHLHYNQQQHFPQSQFMPSTPIHQPGHYVNGPTVPFPLPDRVESNQAYHAPPVPQYPNLYPSVSANGQFSAQQNHSAAFPSDYVPPVAHAPSAPPMDFDHQHPPPYSNN